MSILSPDPVESCLIFGAPGCYACISVMDTGYGMDEETAGKIFDPFFTTKEVGKGTGLGMAIVYGNIQQQNGCITIVSEQGKGTTFRIYLPLITEGSKGEHKAPKQEHAPRGTETVLLAEDDKDVRELHGIFLEEAGYTVIKSVDGQDALCKYMAHMAEVDILFTDVIMPKMNGIRLYEEIRKIRPDMKALFISGYTKDIILERGIIEKEFNLVTKPTTSHLASQKDPGNSRLAGFSGVTAGAGLEDWGPNPEFRVRAPYLISFPLRAVQ